MGLRVRGFGAKNTGSEFEEVEVELAEIGQNPVFAATDVGSNATKIMVWEIEAEKRPRPRFHKRYPLRLDDAFRTGQIGPANIARLVETFAEIGEICRKKGVTRLRAVATDAFRAARNRAEVVRAVETETGIVLEVLSPEEEGRLVAEGVMLDRCNGRRDFLILDIGGGSAEIIRPRPRGDAEVLSLPLGAVRLREAFVRSDPLTPDQYEALCAHVERVVAEGTASLGRRWSNTGVGCGGGVRFLHAMCGVLHATLSQNEPMRLGQLEHLCEAIWPLKVETLVQKYGIERERAEIIVPGAVVARELMRRLDLAALEPSQRGVRDGLLADFLGFL